MLEQSATTGNRIRQRHAGRAASRERARVDGGGPAIFIKLLQAARYIFQNL